MRGQIQGGALEMLWSTLSLTTSLTQTLRRDSSRPSAKADHLLDPFSISTRAMRQAKLQIASRGRSLPPLSRSCWPFGDDAAFHHAHSTGAYLCWSTTCLIRCRQWTGHCSWTLLMVSSAIASAGSWTGCLATSNVGSSSSSWMQASPLKMTLGAAEIRFRFVGD
jgi:hypothetical protein